MTPNFGLSSRARPRRRVAGWATVALLALTMGACDAKNDAERAPADPAPSTTSTTTGT
ncbi:MAG: hypothetical protein L0H96_04885 [Humibacillus sp.]|nr:hypothetical protein [Humibacillus sp.]MDN5776225.1 hypothetical protein [Humibacillus sp.]